MALHCPECGFVNADGANYCQKCGSYLGAREERAGEPSTATYRIDETGELVPVDVEQVVAHEGAAVVIRAGSGRAGNDVAAPATGDGGGGGGGGAQRSKRRPSVTAPSNGALYSLDDVIEE